MHFNRIPGTDLPESIGGTANLDLITGAGGDDTLSGWDNDDRIFGEVGNDVIWAGFGSDSLYGGDGNDTVRGDDNKYVHDDIYRLYGGEGEDELTTYGGVNFSRGGTGNDTIVVCYDVGGVARGGAGDDMLCMAYVGSPYAGGEIDVSVTLNGSATMGTGAMTLAGFERLWITTYHGDDTVIGGNRDDRIEVFRGANTVQALGGGDFVSVIGGAANDLDGGAGHDILTITAWDMDGLALTVIGTSATDDAGSVMAGFEQWMIYGSFFADTVIFGDGDDGLRGYKGADVVQGMGGMDTLDGDSGADTLDGGAGRDVLIGGRKLDLLTGGHGADRFVFEHRTGSGDVITDFASGVDQLRISDRVLSGGLPEGGVADSAFHLDTAIGTGGQFVYRTAGETGQGALIWDGNGTDAGGEIVVALLDGMPVLTAADLGISLFD